MATTLSLLDYSRTPFVRILSNDGFEFFVTKKVVGQSDFFTDKMKEFSSSGSEQFQTISLDKIKAETLDIIVQYLHFKSRHINETPETLPKFHIPPELALDVFQASVQLRL